MQKLELVVYAVIRNNVSVEAKSVFEGPYRESRVW